MSMFDQIEARTESMRDELRKEKAHTEGMRAYARAIARGDDAEARRLLQKWAEDASPAVDDVR